MFRDIAILCIAGRFWCLCVGPVKVPFSDGRFYRSFATIEEAVAFRKENS